jgi:hypothetical protein
MSSSPERTAQLERDLRAAARAFDDVPVSGDAWQQNQQRLAAGRGRQGRTLLAVAAGLVLVVAVGALLLGGSPGGNRTMPAGGGDPFGDSVVLGPPVDVETLTIGGVETTHQAVLSDQTGKGPNLCDRYGTDAGASGGCSSRDPNADDPGVAFDWLTATVGGGDIRGVLAGVDMRVMAVQIWMSNGRMTAATLLPAGWEGTQIVGLTLPADGPRPQRLVAYGDAGRVLQSIDLPSRLGQSWLGGASRCATADPQPLVNTGGLPAVTITATHLGVFTNGRGTPDQCIPLGSSLQGFRSGRDLVLIVPPEVLGVRLEQSGSRTNSGNSGSPAELRGVIWRVLVVHASRPLSDTDTVIAQAANGRQLSSLRVTAFR